MSLQRGAALIVALWALALLSLMMGGVVEAIRLENRQSAYELQHARALFAAEAGLALAIQGVLSSPASVIADGRPYLMVFEGARLRIEIRSERGKLDLNFTSADNFARLVRELGATPAQSLLMDTELRYRHSAGKLFKAVEELQQLPGMDQQLYERMSPYVTLWTGLESPDPEFSDQVIRAALQQGTPNGPGSPGAVLNARIVATLDTNFDAVLDVTFFLTPQGGGAQLYRVLRWKE